MTALRCPSCGGALTDGHDDGRDLVEVWCSECGEEWAPLPVPGGLARPGGAEEAEVYRGMGAALGGEAGRA